jgi:glutamine amidotransferase
MTNYTAADFAVPQATPAGGRLPVAGERLPVALLDYGMGNLRSVARAFERCGADVRLVAEPKQIGDEVAALVFPGQGAIADCMTCLKRTGFDALIREWIAADRPFFGVCLGLQALFEHSEEGDTAGLGIFAGSVRRFNFSTNTVSENTVSENTVNHAALKIPHMGWNTVGFRAVQPLPDGIRVTGDAFYFVHSYHVAGAAPEIIWCETDYGIRFTSGIRHGNCYATQFHPEKSQSKGLAIYSHFLRTAAAARSA